MTKPFLIAMMGLPRSGKSTITSKLSRMEGAPIVRRDAIRLALHGQRWLAEAEPMVKAMSIYMIKALFEAGHETVICDETNYSRAARNALRNDDRWRTVFYPVLTDPSICKERAIKTNQLDLISVIDEMYARYEPLEKGEEWYDYIDWEAVKSAEGSVS